MRVNKWTIGLAAAGLVSLTPALLAQTNAPAPTPIPMLTALSATTISGYVDTSAVWNPGTGNANPAPFAFNAGKQDGFNLDAVDVKIAHPQDETGWSAGYVAELSYGPDAEAIDGGAYPIRQAYVALHMPVGNGIDWELGRWDNLLGYESSDSYKNPNFTRSYGYSMEPTEHTGLLGSYNITSAINLQLGVADTVQTEGSSVNSRYDAPFGEYVESKKSLVSLLTVTAPDSWGGFKGSAFYAGFDLGEGGATVSTAGTPTSPHDRSEIYLGATINTPVTGLTFGASWDSIQHADIGDVDTGYFQAIAGYASFKLTDKLTLNGRAEYADGYGLGYMTAYTPDFNKVLELTGTLQYDLWANVISRLEIRWDHACDSTTPFGGVGAPGSAASLPNKKNDVMIAANVIYKF
ncbi:MAG TPA: outer membrane beta-barrel protein [Verrucomicrobiae bacterium]|nr:outer membrane beta-barrel protein [Verrucomicrobiae bacterium]